MTSDKQLADQDDPLVRFLVDAWLPHSMDLARLRQRIDVNQKYLLARAAVAALREAGHIASTGEPPQ